MNQQVQAQLTKAHHGFVLGQGQLGEWLMMLMHEDPCHFGSYEDMWGTCLHRDCWRFIVLLWVT